MIAAEQAAQRRADAVAELTATGASFEIAVEPVCGVVLPVYRHRRRSLRELLIDSARHGQNEYLVDGELRLTHAQHRDWVAAVARRLIGAGIGPGDRVAILGQPCAEWIVTWWATVAIGSVAVAVNSWWSSGEIRDALDLTQPAVAVVDGALRGMLPEGAPTLSMEDLRELLPDPGAHTVELPGAELGEDDPATILFTSGTTGRSKGVIHSHRNILCANDFHRLNDAVAERLGAPPARRRFLLATPLFHIAGLYNLVVPRLDVGDTAVIVRGRFDAGEVLALIEREGVTNWGAVPTMAARIAAYPHLERYDLSSLRTMSLNSAAYSPALRAAVTAALPQARRALGTTYGSTETATAVTLGSAADVDAYPATAGRVVPTVEVQIRDESGRPLPDGQEGEIHARGPQLMLGYWENEAATTAAFRPGGWYRTGDLGYLEGGQLYVSSRRSDLVVRGGENVYPAEVEAALATHPAVAEIIVYGVTHPELGQEVAAVVVVTPQWAHRGDAELVAALREHAADQIARYKTPTRWRFTSEPLPRNATGKVQIRRVISGG
ncbi:class I adenylate-forming enzyme family protein [Branchiibius hedensis]|uniref:class I adenylate-forming enzyme family protein n=1 Tax=Branchiibius hedensis TaxID=672460 RepID=UPI001B88640B|nr:AMP-binding protein [Branchiibius hedensis]